MSCWRLLVPQKAAGQVPRMQGPQRPERGLSLTLFGLLAGARQISQAHRKASQTDQRAVAIRYKQCKYSCKHAIQTQYKRGKLKITVPAT